MLPYFLMSEKSDYVYVTLSIRTNVLLGGVDMKEMIIRMLDMADERTLRLVYIFLKNLMD